MIHPTSRFRQHDAGLSEVIGFVLIIGLLVVVASLYLTYGVPAQGRENEILHMNEVKDQFVAYKIGLDALFINNKVGTSVSNSFNLGTSGGFTSGSLGVLPILSPVGSAGVIAINDRTSSPETLTISSKALILNNSVHDFSNLPAKVTNAPGHMYVTIANIQPGDLSPTRFFGVQVNGTSWTATVNYTPEMAYYQSYTSAPESGATCVAQNGGQPTGIINQASVYCLRSNSAYFYNWTDIRLSVFKEKTPILQDVTIYRNVSSGVAYAVDLMDNAYGISSSMKYPDNLTISVYDSNAGTPNPNRLSGTGNVTYGYSEMIYNMTPLALGSLEYRAQNYYWIPQTYYYQMGGIFLAQADGNVTYKLPPEITFSFSNSSAVPSEKIVNVNINAVTFDPTNRGVVGGNTPVQIKTTLDGFTPLPFAAGSANAKWIRIGVNTSDDKARVMWSNYFNYSMTTANIPNTVTGNTTTESYVLINGYDTTDSWPDISVIASNATYTTSVRGIGGIVT